VNAVAFTTYKATKDSLGHMPTKATPAPTTEAAPAPARATGEKGRIIKLENAGDEAYIAIASCDKAEGNFGPQYEFRGALQPSDENVRLFIGAAAVERQLQFLGLQAEDVVGKTVQFSRAPNPKGKPFWNIAVKGAGKKAAPKKASFEDAPPPEDDGSFPF
jgi:hypothetical protein